MVGYFSVQSLPRRVRICALPETSRACIGYPSNLISCSQSGPSGAFSASAASCGLIQAGGEAGLTLRRVGIIPVGLARGDFVIATMYQKFALFVGALCLGRPFEIKLPSVARLGWICGDDGPIVPTDLVCRLLIEKNICSTDQTRSRRLSL